MARAGLGLGVRDLAALANVSTNTVTRFERGEDLKEVTVLALKSTLEKQGAIFLFEECETVGVKLRKT